MNLKTTWNKIKRFILWTRITITPIDHNTNYVWQIRGNSHPVHLQSLGLLLRQVRPKQMDLVVDRNVSFIPAESILTTIPQGRFKSRKAFLKAIDLSVGADWQNVGELIVKSEGIVVKKHKILEVQDGKCRRDKGKGNGAQRAQTKKSGR